MSFKYLVFCVILLLSLLTLFFYLFNNPPYKAKTTDECIRERDCVWYAFSKLANFKTMPDSSVRLISKWGRDIQIVAIDDNDGRGVQKIQETINYIQPHIPYKISIEKKFNILILFSDDIVNDVLYKYRDEFRKTYGSDVVAEAVIRNRTKNPGCFYAISHFKDDGYVGGAVIISNRDDENSTQCIRNSVVKVVAFENPIHNFPFSVANFPEIKGQMPTKLDSILMDMLYDPRFDQMKSANQAEHVFDEIYKEKFLVLNQ